MNFHVFKRKKKKPEPKAPPLKAPPPKAPEPEAKAPSAAPKPPLESAPPNIPRPCIRGGAYMDELDRMSRVPGMRNLEVTTSRTFRWNFRDPMDGHDYEYYYQDQGPAMEQWGRMQRPLALPPQYLQHGPAGPLVSSAQPYHDYGYVGAPCFYRYPHCGGGGGYYEDEYPHHFM